LVSLGKDRFGEEVRVNRAVLEHAHVLVIGSVEPHYFAGYTGGRKAIFPGLADFETIARNHNLANSLEAAPLRLRGNPVAEHLDSLLNMLDQDKILGIQVVSDCSHKLAGVFCGPLNRAFHEACKMAEDVYSCAVSAPYDIVLCEVLPPLDRNLYQAQKALENCQAAVTDGGVVVIVSACTEGVGSEYFYRLAASWDKSANRAGDGGLHFGSHKLSRVIEIGRRIDVLLHSTLPPDMVRRVFYEPLDNLPDFSYSRGQECEIRNMAVVHDAANLVLMTN
jgi:nickel-dependent lactate racemase